MGVELLRVLGTLLGMVALALVALSLLGDATYRSSPRFDEPLPASAAADLAVAAPDEALTFARVAAPGGPRLLLVERVRDGQLTGVDLSGLFAPPDADPITLFTALGYEQILRAVAPAAPRVQAPLETLTAPFEAGLSHISRRSVRACFAYHLHVHDATTHDVLPRKRHDD